jgi:hypothetical protein
MNKLDPDSELNRNAKEVMDERAKNKRKLREIQEAELEAESAQAPSDDGDDADNVTKEAPGEGLKRRDDVPNKKPKREDKDFAMDNLTAVFDDNPANMTQEDLMKLAKRDAQRADRAAKKERQAEKRAAKKAAKEAAAAEKAEKKNEAADDKTNKTPKKTSEPATKQKAKGKAKDTETPSNDHDRDDGYETVSDDDEEADKVAAAPTPKPTKTTAAPADAEDKPVDSTPSSVRSASNSPVFDTADATQAAATTDVASTTTSISSTVPPSDKPKQIKVPQDTSALKARLAARIAELQAARKAIGPDGKPIRTRQELIEAQRARQAQRSAKKKDQRLKARLEEERQRDEALASNSPSIMSPALDHLLADDNEDAPTDYSFGRVAFNDNTRLSRDLTHALNTHKKKGPSDAKTALIKLQNQRKKHEAMDEEKQKDIAEKETWLTARRRAEGERIHDDEATLKKTIKRKDKQKKKSEREWKDRAEGVQSAIKAKQRKREDNLKKRKDEKKLGKAGKKLKVKGPAAKKKGGRPGFEGSFGGMGGKKTTAGKK